MSKKLIGFLIAVLLILPISAQSFVVKTVIEDSKISSIFTKSVLDQNRKKIDVEIKFSVENMDPSGIKLKKSLEKYNDLFTHSLERFGWKRICYSLDDSKDNPKWVPITNGKRILFNKMDSKRNLYKKRCKSKIVKCISKNSDPVSVIDERSIDILLKVENFGDREKVIVFYNKGSESNYRNTFLYYEDQYGNISEFFDKALIKAIEKIKKEMNMNI